MRILDDDAYREECQRRSRLIHETTLCWEVQATKLRRAVFGRDTVEAPESTTDAEAEGRSNPDSEAVIGSRRLGSAN